MSISNDDKRTYWADLTQLYKEYARQHKDAWELDIIDALGEIIDEHYFNITPPPYKEDLTRLLTEYADSKGAKLADVLGVLIDVIPDLIADIKAMAETEEQATRRKK